jgi:hypothetical protein
MTGKSESAQVEEEMERRRDDALRRALATPPKRHKVYEERKDEAPKRRPVKSK